MAQMDDDLLWEIFKQVDLNQNGSVDPQELQACLMNGWDFSHEVCQRMVRMFDKDAKGRVTFQDFKALWKYITRWQERFTQFDKDESGSINNHELLIALQSLGFTLQLKTVNTIIRRFDKGNEGEMYFDDFIHCCIILQNITSGFKKHDPENIGEINIKYEDLIDMVFEAGF